MRNKSPRELWQDAMQTAGYLLQNGELHFSALAQPGGDRRAAETAYRDWLSAEPRNAKALEGLAWLLQLLGRQQEAVPLRHALLDIKIDNMAIAAADRSAAREYLAASQGLAARVSKANEAYVAALFDDYADTFDSHLTKSLGYRTPAVLLETARALPDKASPPTVLDLGCGTGLAGVAFKPYAKALHGVDLSSGMLQVARKRGIYDRLVQGEAVAFLEQDETHYDLIIAADVLNYFGNLEAIMLAGASRLLPDGFLIWSFEHDDGESRDGFTLRNNGRFRHTPDYIQRCARAAELDPLELTEAVLRYENQIPVAGLILTARRSTGATLHLC